MRLAALCSGGKDSSYALWLALMKGHEIARVVTMIPKQENSWMFHRPNTELIRLFAKASTLPLTERRIPDEREEELEILKRSLEKLSIDGVVSGAIASTYQRNRIEGICKELEFVSLMPLWNEDPSGLLKKMLEDGFEIIITSVSAGGLNEEWLGRKIDKNCLDDLKMLNEKFGIHITGEGGEYETLVLDAPFFGERIDPIETEIIWEGDRGRLEVKKAELTKK